MNKRALQTAVARFPGATLEPISAGDYEGFHVEAPDGKRWVDGGVRSLRVEWRTENKEHKAESVRDALGRIQCGLRDATDEELADE